MAAGKKGICFAVLLYSIVLNLEPNTPISGTNSRDNTLWNSSTYNISTDHQSSISNGHDKLYDLLLSPSFRGNKQQGEGRTAYRRRRRHDDQTTTKQTQEINVLFLILSLLTNRDVHPCPGPRNVKTPCVECSKGVISTSRALSCDRCDKWTHIR